VAGGGAAIPAAGHIEHSAKLDRIEGRGQQGTGASEASRFDQLEAFPRIRQSASSFWAGSVLTRNEWAARSRSGAS